MVEDRYEESDGLVCLFHDFLLLKVRAELSAMTEPHESLTLENGEVSEEIRSSQANITAQTGLIPPGKEK